MWRGRIGGIEIECRADVARGWQGYAPREEPPQVIVEYEAIDDYLGAAPVDRPYPAFGCRALSSTKYELWRADSHGTIDVGDVTTARFTGRPLRHTVEGALRLALSLALPRVGGLLLHASGTVVGERAFLFSGPSGAGKSTVAGLLAPRRCLGDDLTIARDGVVHATPFSGDADPAPDGDAPLAGLCFLIKGERHALTPLGRADALRRLMRNVVAYVSEREAAARVLAAAARFVETVPCFVLEFARDPGLAALLEVT